MFLACCVFEQHRVVSQSGCCRYSFTFTCWAFSMSRTITFTSAIEKLPSPLLTIGQK
jgi:hypothetical protein